MTAGDLPDESSAAARAWDRLDAALRETVPACTDIELFTAGGLREPERAVLAPICASCGVLSLCDAYATAAHIRFGFWGGRDRAQSKPTTAPGGTRQPREKEQRS